MSIPLVQNNEKDSINTSIIAIKRNIERINMLLGLSNSEEIDTSKFATKDELQQAVTDLQPVDEVALNNMHSVTSNAVAEAGSYSTTEKFTGKYWIDGKPIYTITTRSTIEVTLYSDNYRDVGAPLPQNAETYIKVTAASGINNVMYYNYMYATLYCAAFEYITLPIGTDFTFEYTKTTD